MANIPTIPGSARVQDQTIGVKANAGPALNRLAAERGVAQAAGGAVQDTIGAVAEFEERKRRAEEVNAFNQASILTRKTTSTYRDSLRNNPNDQEWVANWQKTSQDTRDQILSSAGSKLSAGAKAKMVQTLDNWQGETTTEFTTAADIAGSERRKRTGMLAADEALKDGNEQAATAAIDSIVRTGDMWKEEATTLKGTFRQTVETNQVLTGMATNPAMVYDQLREKDDKGNFANFPAIRDPAVRERLIRESNQRMNALQSQNLQDIVEQVGNAPEAPPTEEELEAKVKTGDITARGANSIRALVKKSNLDSAKDNSLVLAMQVHDHDFTVDKNPDVTAREFHDSIAALPIALQKPISDQLTNKLNAAKKNEQQVEKPVESYTYDWGKKMFSDGMFRGQVDVDTPKKFLGFTVGHETKKEDASTNPEWMKTAKAPEIAQARLNYAKWVDSMRSFFTSNPKATQSEAEEYSQKLLTPHVEDQVRAALAR